MGRFRHIVMAIAFGIGFVGCGTGSQAGLDPGASAQGIQRPVHSSSVRKATSGFTWSHSTVNIPAGQTLYVSMDCSAGQTVINGTLRKKHIGNDITVIESFPVTNYSWQITATNNGNHQESIVAYLLCTSGS